MLGSLEADRRAGTLAGRLTTSRVRYGVDPNIPERLMAIDDLGNRWDPEEETQIRARIESMPPGRLFRLMELPEYQASPAAVVAVTEFLVNESKLTWYREDLYLYYRPKPGILIEGPQPLSYSEKLRIQLSTRGQRTGYITGAALYNRLGLTTQVPCTVEVATLGPLEREDLGSIKVKMIKARVAFVEQDIPALEILDALTDIDRIPDTSSQEALRLLRLRFRELSPEVRQRARGLASSYPQETQALLSQIMGQPSD